MIFNFYLEYLRKYIESYFIKILSNDLTIICSSFFDWIIASLDGPLIPTLGRDRFGPVQSLFYMMHLYPCLWLDHIYHIEGSPMFYSDQ